MTVRVARLTLILVLCSPALARENPQTPLDSADTALPEVEPDCQETEDCMVVGLGLSDEQQERVREILQQAGKKQEDLRDDTVRQLEDVLTPEQARQLEGRRAEILAHRANRLRHKARRMEQRARQLKETQ